MERQENADLRSRDRRRWTRAALALALALACALAPAASAQLDDSCVATILNRSVRVNADGSFLITDIPVEAGLFRARVSCDGGEAYNFDQLGVTSVPGLIAGQEMALDGASISSAAALGAGPLALTAGTGASIFGGDTTTPAGTLASVAGGVLIVGDVARDNILKGRYDAARLFEDLGKVAGVPGFGKLIKVMDSRSANAIGFRYELEVAVHAKDVLGKNIDELGAAVVSAGFIRPSDVDVIAGGIAWNVKATTGALTGYGPNKMKRWIVATQALPNVDEVRLAIPKGQDVPKRFLDLFDDLQVDIENVPHIR